MWSKNCYLFVFVLTTKVSLTCRHCKDRVLPEIFDKPHKPWLLLMCMPILPDKIMQRQRIRSTYMQFPEVECPWCIPRHENPVIRFRFFVATNDSKGNPYPLVLVEEEQRAYGDIVFLVRLQLTMTYKSKS
jgi:hypothetical protein